MIPKTGFINLKKDILKTTMLSNLKSEIKSPVLYRINSIYSNGRFIGNSQSSSESQSMDNLRRSADPLADSLSTLYWFKYVAYPYDLIQTTGPQTGQIQLYFDPLLQRSKTIYRCLTKPLYHLSHCFFWYLFQLSEFSSIRTRQLLLIKP